MSLKILLIDDNEDAGKRISKRFKKYLKINNIAWEVVFLLPFQNINDYQPYIVENKVILVVIDEKLRKKVNNKAIKYDGHQVVQNLRGFNKDLPIYIVTAFDKNDDFKKVEGLMDGVVGRTDLTDAKECDKYISRMVRSTHRYLDNYTDEISKLAELSSKIATGNYTENDLKKLNAIRKKLEITSSVPDNINRNNWITKMEAEVEELEKLILEIKSNIR